jgi:hypothetical protein
LKIDITESEVKAAASQNGASSNGNGFASSNGVSTLASSNGVSSNGTSNGVLYTNGNGKSASQNGVASKAVLGTNGTAAALNGTVPVAADVAVMDPCASGALEACAATRADPSAAPEKLTAAGTPYSSPGGRWSKIKGYSTFQVGRSSSRSCQHRACCLPHAFSGHASLQPPRGRLLQQGQQGQQQQQQQQQQEQQQEERPATPLVLGVRVR